MGAEAETTQTAEAEAPEQATAPAGAEQQQAPEATETPESDTATEAPKDEVKAESDGAPEAYEFTIPDGVEFPEEAQSAFSEVARELNLSQEAAQQVVDKVAPVMVRTATERLSALRTEWAEQAKADKEMGGDKFDANLGVAKGALERFASPELVALLNESGLGNHPEMVRAWLKVGRAISDDGMVPSKGAPSPAPSDPAKRLYPDMA